MSALVDVLTEYAWLVFALCAVMMLFGALTLVWHVRESRCGSYVYLASGAGLLLAAGFVLGGMQAGDRPVVAREVLIPWIRLFWVGAAGLGFAFLTIYWLRRFGHCWKWRGRGTR